jgi:thiamine transport system substrate-binding protein
MLKITFLTLTLLSVSSQSFATPSTELVIYTNDSFVSEWGPGPALKKNFESECNCKIKWIATADGAAILARLKIDGLRSKADVVLGLDDSTAAAVDSLGFFAESGIPKTSNAIEKFHKHSPKLVPYDFGFYSFMFDTEARQKDGKLFKRPTSLDDLLTSEQFSKSVLIQDPRSSATGLGLLFWLKSVYGDAYEKALSKLRQQTLKVGKGWSESYSLFTKGEAPFVLSYSTSEAYHREVEKTSRFQALIFPEGHYAVVESAGILKSSKNKALAKSFLEFLLREKSQQIIASMNWMYPIINTTKNLPAAFSTIQKPNKVLSLSPSIIDKNRRTWTEQWEKTFRK